MPLVARVFIKVVEILAISSKEEGLFHIALTLPICLFSFVPQFMVSNDCVMYIDP